MRIVCPRCVAQYEVDESAIPETGREVQCANCENIWFQDYIEMLPTSADDDVDAGAEEDQGVFDDLDGKTEASFYSNRGSGPDVVADNQDPLDDDDPADLLADDDAYDEDAYDDDEPATNIPVPPVDEEVLDVLRSEAAFSSARDQLDVATANALDGDGEAIKSALDDNTPPAAEVDELTAFLDAHSEPEKTEAEPEELVDDVEEDIEDAPADPDFDPLADLEAIRSQLNDMGEEQASETEYAPNLPIDDPIEDAGSLADDGSDNDAAPEEPRSDDPEFDAAALTAALDAGGLDVDDDFDDEDDGTRHAYRADGITPSDTIDDADDEVEDALPNTDGVSDDLAAALKEASSEETDAEDDAPTEEGSEAVTAAAAAVGLTRPRPRAKGSRARARTLPGFDEGAETSAPPKDDLAATISEAVDDVADTVPDDLDLPEIDEEKLAAAVDTSRKADPNRRPKRDGKALLPDVDELDASLRSEPEEPRRRDREMMEAHEEELANASKGGFRRAFIWTLFIIALLIALYVLRPQLVAALPAAAMVLDPYAAAIDSVRALINGLIG